jgi:hypothetical protein
MNIRKKGKHAQTFITILSISMHRLREKTDAVQVFQTTER